MSSPEKSTPEEQLAEAVKPRIQELIKTRGVADLVKQFSAKKEGTPALEVRKQLSEAIVKMPEIAKIVNPASKEPDLVLKTPDPVVVKKPDPVVVKKPDPVSKEPAKPLIVPERSVVSHDLADVIMKSKSITGSSKERFAKLSGPGQLKIIEVVKELSDPIPNWKVAQALSVVEKQEPAYIEAQRLQVEKQKQPALSGEKEASKQREASIGAQIGDSNKRARQQQEAAGKDKSEIALVMNKTLEFAEITAGGEYSFRAIGEEFTPWRIRRDGFTRHPKNKVEMTVLQIVEALYCGFADGAAEYMALYRGGTANNDSRLNLPFLSAGPLMAESQGASGGFWQYAVSVAKAGLSEVPIASIRSQVSRPVIKADSLDGLSLYTNGTLAGATAALLKHGPMGEETWITVIPSSCVIAFTCLHGADWMQRWTYMKDAGTYLEICKKTKGGEKLAGL